MSKRFATIDTDGDGSLSSDEMKAFTDKMQAQPQRQDRFGARLLQRYGSMLDDASSNTNASQLSLAA